MIKDNLKKLIGIVVSNPLSMPWRLVQFARRLFPFDYYFLNGYSFAPDVITILITKRCNFHCIGCSSASPKFTQENKGGQADEMKLEQIIKLIDDIAPYNPCIYLNGGEPSLRADLVEIIRYAKKKRLIVAFTSNSSLMTEDLAEEIVVAGLDFYSVSVDGQKEYHDQRRGFSGAYQLAVDGTRRILGVKQKLNKRNPHVRITCIIDAKKVDNAWHVLNLANQLKIDEVAFGNLMFYPKEVAQAQDKFIKNYSTGGKKLFGLELGQGQWLEADSEDLRKFYQTARKRSRIPVFFSLSESDLKNYYSSKPLTLSRCLTPWLIGIIQPNGDLTTCQEQVVGNIGRERFQDIWNNAEMRKFRSVRKRLQMPACWRCLEGQEIKFD